MRPDSDLVTLWRLWSGYISSPSRTQRQWCQQHGVVLHTMQQAERKMQKLRRRMPADLMPRWTGAHDSLLAQLLGEAFASGFFDNLLVTPAIVQPGPNSRNAGIVSATTEADSALTQNHSSSCTLAVTVTASSVPSPLAPHTYYRAANGRPVKLQETSGVHLARGSNTHPALPPGHLLLFCGAHAAPSAVYASFLAVVDLETMQLAAPTWWDSEGDALLQARGGAGLACDVAEARWQLPLGLLQRLCGSDRASWKQRRRLEELAEPASFRVRRLPASCTHWGVAA